MNAKLRVLVLLGVAMMMLLGACSGVSDAATVAPIPEIEDVAAPPQDAPVREDPRTAVEDFYAWYLSYQGSPLADRAYADQPVVTDALVRQVDDLVASFEMGGYDPFLCAQDRPGEVTVASVDISGDAATAHVTSSLVGHSFDVALRATGETWQMTDVICGFDDEAASAQPPAAQVPADEDQSASAGPREVVPGWPVLLDDTYHFMVQYPEGWAYEDVDLDDPNQPPAGKMSRLVFLQPDDWDEGFVALQLEVYEMDEATFAQEFFPGTTVEEITRDDGVAYVKHTHELGPAVMVQYVFQQPSNPDVRVVFTDYVSGWPDRLAGNEGVAAEFEPILASFGFTQ